MKNYWLEKRYAGVQIRQVVFKWYALRKDRSLNLLYLQKDGTWRPSCMKNDQPTGYFDTKEEIEQCLKK